jgi:hypothetical protein
MLILRVRACLRMSSCSSDYVKSVFRRLLLSLFTETATLLQQWNRLQQTRVTLMVASLWCVGVVARQVSVAKGSCNARSHDLGALSSLSHIDDLTTAILIRLMSYN